MKLEFGPDTSASSPTPSSSVSAAARLSRRFGDMLGLACLVASLLLMSTGVRTVKAEGEALMSVDPQRVEAQRQKAAVKIVPESNKASANANANTNAAVAGQAARKPQTPANYQGPGVPAIEVEPGVVVLNTRGYNYGPPPAAIDPAAMRVEENLQQDR